MKSALLLLAVLLYGCGDKGVLTNKTDNPNLDVTLLFTHDGCRVYRFIDGTSYRYFTNCSQTFWEESCGKNCTQHVSIPTGQAGCK